MKEIWLLIKDEQDIKDLIYILVTAGYRVRLVRLEDKLIPTLINKWVVFETPENNIK